MNERILGKQERGTKQLGRRRRKFRPAGRIRIDNSRVATGNCPSMLAARERRGDKHGANTRCASRCDHRRRTFASRTGARNILAPPPPTPLPSAEAAGHAPLA